MLATMSDAIITLSLAQRAEILGYGIGRPEKVYAIGLGLPLDPFVQCGPLRRGQLRQELGVSQDAPLIGIVARLVPVKGHKCFLDAARYTLARIPGALSSAETENYAQTLNVTL